MRRPLILALAISAGAAAALAGPALGAKDDLILISRADGPAGAPVDASAFSPAITASGERVAFASSADNLSAEDDNGVTNIFVRDAAANTTVLVTRATGARAPAPTAAPAARGSGRRTARRLHLGRRQPVDRGQRRRRQRLRAGPGGGHHDAREPRLGPGGAPADARAHDAGISADGRYVVFRSGADNLSPDDDEGVDNIFVRDLVANTTTLVSRRAGAGGAPANDSSFNPSISGDGNRVAFSSGANNLSNEDVNGVGNIFVRDLAAATVTLVSRATGAGGAPANDSSDSPSIRPRAAS